MNYIIFNLTVTKDFILSKKNIPIISFSETIIYLLKPFYMSIFFKNKSCVEFIVQLCQLPMKMLSLSKKMHTKYLFLLIDPVTTLLTLLK